MQDEQYLVLSRVAYKDGTCGEWHAILYETAAGAAACYHKMREESYWQEIRVVPFSRVLVLPNGARVEGLSLDELAALIRELT